jgi:predicted nucleotidyltransferase
MDTDAMTALASNLAADSDVVLAYLFGSRARGRAGAQSDYDIAVLASHAVSLAQRLELASRLSATLGGAAVDLVLLNEAPVDLAYAVLAEGQLLFERTCAERVEYEANILSRYSDMLPIYRQQRAELLQGANYAAGVRRHRAALDTTRRLLGKTRGAPKHDAG